MKKKLKLSGWLVASLLFLSACGQGDVTSASTGFWDQLVYWFGQVIQWLSIGGQLGVGIILMTLILRLLLLPLFQKQMASSQVMQELQPRIKAIQKKYEALGLTDMESRGRQNDEIQALYTEAGVSPLGSMWPLAIQMPILMALFQALSRVPELRVGHFLWLNLAQPDPYYVLPLLAAALTFLSTWLMNKGLAERTGSATVMMIVMPLMIFFLGLRISSGVALYWVASNAFQVAQTLLLNNPFEKIAAREAEAAAARELAAKKRRAAKKAQKKRNR